VTYNLTSISENATSFLEFTQGVNDVLLDGWFGVGILISIFVVLIIGFTFVTQDIRKSLIGSSFICFVTALSLRGLDLLPNLAIWISLLVLAVSIAFTFKNQ